ncbi:hypothetical protein AWB81_07131 [Caballeronia arationis]|nr:hypothetical protein AWB81_07131 [Caballeronia arationis]
MGNPTKRFDSDIEQTMIDELTPSPWGRDDGLSEPATGAAQRGALSALIENAAYAPASLAPMKPPAVPATSANRTSSSTNRHILRSKAAFAATICAAPLLS